MFVPKTTADALGALEKAFVLSTQSEATGAKVRRAVRKKQLVKQPAAELYKTALSKGVINQTEYDSISEAEVIRNQVIQVDDFALDEYKSMCT
jgi:hypothetical protein